MNPCLYVAVLVERAVFERYNIVGDLKGTVSKLDGVTRAGVHWRKGNAKS
jgi:hypothetical protein